MTWEPLTGAPFLPLRQRFDELAAAQDAKAGDGAVTRHTPPIERQV
jgi:hypothetical protein